MKTTYTNHSRIGSTRFPTEQRGFFTVALGLALTALVGATSAVIVSTHETDEMNGSVTMQQLDTQAIQTASIRGN